MADSLHNTLAAFRDSILQSIARLEFQMRDNATTVRQASNPQFEVDGNHSHRINTLEQSAEQDREMFKQMIAEQQNKTNTIIQSFLSRLESLEAKLSSTAGHSSESVEEILTIEEPATTRNIIIPSVRSTPALTAALAAAIPEPVVLDSESEHSGEVVEEESEVQEEEEEEDSGPDLTKVIIKGVSYYMDSSNTVYQETEDGYEEVGTYNPKLDRIEVAQEEEDEEEAIETEEFTYKGQTYQRDAEGNVYDDEGDVIGFWNGKKIVAAVA